jgi:hypothetical protein
MSKGRWTDEEDRNLQAWLADGLTVPRISVRLRRTVNSVKSRCKSLGLSSGRRTLGQPLRGVHSTIFHVEGSGKKQLIEVPNVDPVMLKEPPSA